MPDRIKTPIYLHGAATGTSVVYGIFSIAEGSLFGAGWGFGLALCLVWNFIEDTWP